MTQYIEAKVRLEKMMYPKSGHKDGEFAIASLQVTKEIEGQAKVDGFWGTIIAKGNIPKLEVGIDYLLKANEEWNEKYRSWQYDILYLGVPFDFENITKEDTRDFLNAVLGENLTKSLMSKLQNPMKSILDEDIETLCTVKGIKTKRAYSIINRVNANMDKSKVYIELKEYELSKKIIDNLLTLYKSADMVIAKIKENPYILCSEVRGIGFKKADKIALNAGISRISPLRIKSFIKVYLDGEAQMGRSYIRQQELMSKIISELDIEKSDEMINNVRESIYDLKENDILWWDENKTIMALVEYKNLEVKILKEILRLGLGNRTFDYDNWKEIIREIEKEQGWNYTKEQFDGIESSLVSNVSIITGLAGTGKTTITNAVNKVLDKYKIAQCALSGKASQRIKEVTNREASTIHRLLGLGFSKEPANTEQQLMLDGVLLDEASMVNAKLFLALLEAIPTGAKVFILGDFGQLTSIGCGNVFMDLLGSTNIVNIIKLNEVHRQAQASAITSKSIEIRKQKQIFDSDFTGREVLGELQDLELDIDNDRTTTFSRTIAQFKEKFEQVKDIHKIQIITPVKYKGDASCHNLNLAIQNIYNKETKGIDIKGESGYSYRLKLKDKIIVTKNNYDVHTPSGEKTVIFNGNMGTIIDIDDLTNSITIDIIGTGEVILTKDEIKSIELGYAITVHKAQGSQSDVVIFALDMGSYNMLCSEILYTGITRAIKYAVLVGENKAIRMAIDKLETNNKQTFLPIIIDRYNKGLSYEKF